MVERVQECMDNGDLKQDDAEEIATLLLAVSNGFFGLYVSKTFEAQEPEMKKIPAQLPADAGRIEAMSQSFAAGIQNYCRLTNFLSLKKLTHVNFHDFQNSAEFTDKTKQTTTLRRFDMKLSDLPTNLFSKKDNCSEHKQRNHLTEP